MSLLHVQTGLECVDYLCLAADGSRLAVSQLANGREVWAAPFWFGRSDSEDRGTELAGSSDNRSESARRDV
jgi:hypothetical protein